MLVDELVEVLVLVLVLDEEDDVELDVLDEDDVLVDVEVDDDVEDDVELDVDVHVRSLLPKRNSLKVVVSVNSYPQRYSVTITRVPPPCERP